MDGTLYVPSISGNDDAVDASILTQFYMRLASRIANSFN